VGASLLAMAGCLSALMLLIHRYREQARSHKSTGIMTFYVQP